MACHPGEHWVVHRCCIQQWLNKYNISCYRLTSNCGGLLVIIYSTDFLYNEIQYVFLGLELREDITTMLEPGMVVSMEPMIMVPPEKPGAGGYRYEAIK